MFTDQNQTAASMAEVSPLGLLGFLVFPFMVAVSLGFCLFWVCAFVFLWLGRGLHFGVDLALNGRHRARMRSLSKQLAGMKAQRVAEVAAQAVTMARERMVRQHAERVA